MKALFALCLAVSIAPVAATHTHQASVSRSTHINQSSAPRSFLFYFKEKMRNVCLEIEEMKKKINECCNQAGQCTFSVVCFLPRFPILFLL